ncbi:MAG: metal-dependent hydrolase [Ignavibacteriales bacterium]|nr:metal-dependent hydrolase [Ignavibacteriales bacterium]
MFIGHFGTGLAAKKLEPKISLGTLFLAAQFIDLLWPIFLLLGIEKVIIEPGNTSFTPLNFISYPYSHSLLGVLIWSLLFGIIYFLYKKNIKSALLLAALVMSHWILDLFTHRPDLPLLPWIDFKMGFGLWNSVALTIIVEGGIFILGSYFYITATKAKNKKGSYSLWGLLIFLALVYVMNIIGPPPNEINAIAVVGMFQWILIAWGYWIDKNRNPVNN